MMGNPDTNSVTYIECIRGAPFGLDHCFEIDLKGTRDFSKYDWAVPEFVNRWGPEKSLEKFIRHNQMKCAKKVFDDYMGGTVSRDLAMHLLPHIQPRNRWPNSDSPEDDEGTVAGYYLVRAILGVVGDCKKEEKDTRQALFFEGGPEWARPPLPDCIPLFYFPIGKVEMLIDSGQFDFSVDNGVLFFKDDVPRGIDCQHVQEVKRVLIERDRDAFVRSVDKLKEIPRDIYPIVYLHVQREAWARFRECLLIVIRRNLPTPLSHAIYEYWMPKFIYFHRDQKTPFQATFHLCLRQTIHPWELQYNGHGRGKQE